MIDVSDIEKRIDRAIAGPMPLNARPAAAGPVPQTVSEGMEMAKLMAISGPCVPKYMRGQAGICFAIMQQAYRWGMDPFAVAQKSYLVINHGEERIAFESQLVHSVVISLAPLKGRLRSEIIGDGDDRRCKVWGTFIKEDEPHSYTSETLGRLRDARGRNEKGVLKGSPLWEQQPEVQLYYSATRQWARMFCPDVLLGIYTPEDARYEEPRDVTPPSAFDELKARLKAAEQARVDHRGFDAERVARDGTAIIEGTATKDADDGQQGNSSESDEQGREDLFEYRTDGDHDATGSAGAGDDNPNVGEVPAGQAAAQEQKESGATGKGPKGKR